MLRVSLEKMGTNLDVLNEYGRNARLKPALLASLPVAFVVLGYGLESSVLLGAIFGPLATVGLTYLLAHMMRDLGVRKQVELFEAWGGKPSVTKLRHRDTSLNPHTRERYHASAAEALGRLMPTAEEEEADPVAADLLYEAYSNVLLERTRNTKVYRLLFEELISYGFRRSLLAIRPVGLSLCVVCTAVETGSFVHSLRLTGRLQIESAIFVGLDLFLLACWWFVIGPTWVRRAAESYAERLLAASENPEAMLRTSWSGRVKAAGSKNQSAHGGRGHN